MTGFDLKRWADRCELKIKREELSLSLLAGRQNLRCFDGMEHFVHGPSCRR